MTINDWPALSNLSGQTNKGYHACTHCLDDTESIYLDKCRKNVYLGHRRFLPTNHQCRKKGKHFKGEADHRKKPAMRTGDHVLAMVNDLHVIFGKGPGALAVPNDAEGHAPMWKKKSIFWDLPYWKRPRGPLFNRRDARDEEPLREPARLLGRVWEDKRYT